MKDLSYDTVKQALNFMGQPVREMREFPLENPFDDYMTRAWKRNGIIIKTLEGSHLASSGDYIIKGVKGEFYPCKPDIFELTYELVER